MRQALEAPTFHAAKKTTPNSTWLDAAKRTTSPAPRPRRRSAADARSTPASSWAYVSDLCVATSRCDVDKTTCPSPQPNLT